LPGGRGWEHTRRVLARKLVPQVAVLLPRGAPPSLAQRASSPASPGPVPERGVAALLNR